MILINFTDKEYELLKKFFGWGLDSGVPTEEGDPDHKKEMRELRAGIKLFDKIKKADKE